MYRYTDTTYPLYEVVSMETSLYEAVGLVTFRFELVQAVGRAAVYDSFKVKALYKLLDRAAAKDFAKFSGYFRLPDAVSTGDRFRFTSTTSSRERTQVFDAAVFRLTNRFASLSKPRSVFRVRASTSVVDRSAPFHKLSARVSSRQASSVGCGEFFSMGCGVTWRTGLSLSDQLKCSATLVFVDRSAPYSYFKIKGGKERENDGSSVADFAVFLAESRYAELTESSEKILIKNPHSSSFLLGASGPANTALGGRTYA